MILLSSFLHLRPRRCGPFAGLGRGSGPAAGSRRALRVLVDMDGVLADFEGGFLKKFRARYPDKPYIALEDRRGFWVSEQYGRLGPELSWYDGYKEGSMNKVRGSPTGKVLNSLTSLTNNVSSLAGIDEREMEDIVHAEKAISIWESKNFFIELDPLPGAVEAVKQMANLADTDVFICTSPIKKYRYCPYEKYAWVEKHFGPEFLEQIVLTRDKTVVSADLLIDDRPDITGAEQNPSWEHVLFTACHNKHLQLKPPSRRLQSWTDDWKAILDSKRLPPGRAA